MVFSAHVLRYLIISYAILIGVGTILLSLPPASSGPHPTRVIDALFTAASAVSITGLTVVDTGTHYSLFGQLVILTLIQIGGLGIMTIASIVTILTAQKIGYTERLLLKEEHNHLTVKGVVRITKRIIYFTLGIELVGAALLAQAFINHFGPTGIYYAIWHAVSAFTNAGFDVLTSDSSFVPFATSWHINLVMMVLIVIGGLGFVAIRDIRSKFLFKTTLSLHTKIVVTATITLILAGTLLIWLFEHQNPATLAHYHPTEKWLISAFQSVTTRTAGFATIPTENLTDRSHFIMKLLMFIGASPGSTGGGIKTTTFIVILVSLWAFITNQSQVSLFNRRLGADTIQKALTLLSVMMILILSSTFILSFLEKDPLPHLLFETISAYSTVGLSLGTTQTLSDPGKIIVALSMILGRLGPLSFLLAFFAKKDHSKRILYPKTKVIIG